MLFCDIRGYTAFAEQHEPELVVEVLNFYFQHLAGWCASTRATSTSSSATRSWRCSSGEAHERRRHRLRLAMQDEDGASSAPSSPSWDLDGRHRRRHAAR